MPRIILGHEPRSHHPELVAELAEELRSNRLFGQPVIREQHFPKTHAVSIQVIWDQWEPIADEERLATILEAYEQVESKEFRDRIALAIGLTVPEAHEAGLLPVKVTTMLRKSDPVTQEECRAAMIEMGGSVLSNPQHPELRFATLEEADQAIQHLIERLPGSEPVWNATQEVSQSLDLKWNVNQN